MRLVATAALLAGLLAGCTREVIPLPSPTPRPPEMIRVADIDGPPLTVMLGERLLGKVTCGGPWLGFWVGDGVLPVLPWRMTLRRADGSVFKELDLVERPDTLVVIRGPEAYAGSGGSVGPEPSGPCPT